MPHSFISQHWIQWQTVDARICDSEQMIHFHNVSYQWWLCSLLTIRYDSIVLLLNSCKQIKCMMNIDLLKSQMLFPCHGYKIISNVLCWFSFINWSIMRSSNSRPRGILRKPIENAFSTINLFANKLDNIVLSRPWSYRFIYLTEVLITDQLHIPWRYHTDKSMRSQIT